MMFTFGGGFKGNRISSDDTEAVKLLEEIAINLNLQLSPAKHLSVNIETV